MMTMTRQHMLRALALGAMLLPLGACAGEYPAMVRARDQTIRDLETRLAAQQRENDALRQRNGALASQNESLSKRKPEVVKVPMPVEDDLSQLSKALPPEVSVRYTPRGLSIGVPSSVTFASGKTTISAQGRKVLSRVARVIRKQYPDKKLFIEGHTDSDPIRKTKNKYRSNRHLSAERADAVASYLESAGGIASRKIVILGYGPWDPIDSGDKAANRRVEIVVAEN